MKELSKDELRNLQLNILKYIHEVCTENNITYYIFFGTLIGAVRHKGFIPWDDDIDICMKREDYNKFAKIVKKQNKYDILSYETDPKYYFAFARVSDKNTQLILKNIREVNNFGVFIDVFQIDNAPFENEIEEWYSEYNSLTKRIRYTIPSKLKKTDLKGKLSRIKNYPARIYYGVRNFNKYMQKRNELITKYNSIETNQCIIAGTPYGTKAIFDKEDFNGVTELEFEGMKVYAPIGYDKLLKQLYGNYMELPPESKRKSTHHFKAYWK